MVVGAQTAYYLVSLRFFMSLNADVEGAGAEPSHDYGEEELPLDPTSGIFCNPLAIALLSKANPEV